MKVGFDGGIRLEFHGAKLSSNGGLLAYRDLDHALGLFNSVSTVFIDKRTGRNIQHAMPTLLRQSIYSRLAGYEDVNDAERLSVDPVMRAITGKKDNCKQAASANTMGRFETDILTQQENLRNLSDINGKWVQKAMRKTQHNRIIIDMDSSVSPVHGEQEGSAYNGHFGCICFHPLFCFNQFGDCEGVLLRPGNVHSADRWKEVLEPIVKRYENRKNRKYFRGDAAFAKPEIYEYLEGSGYLYAIRLPANDKLYEKIRHLLTRPVGRPPKKPIVLIYEFSYQAGSWDKPRRVVAKVEWHQGELFPRVGFIVTTMSAKPEGVVHFYNGRGTAEQWIKEGKYALNWTRLSCKRFVSNQVRLWLFVLAYNLGNFLRRLVLPRKIKHWSLRSLLVKLIKIGAKVVRHSRYVTFQMAEVAIDKKLFAEILALIERLRFNPA
ncbi:IS1380 family transposase [Candidatus Latescibacterota bacterium]